MSTRPYWFVEVWEDFRPLAIGLTSDLLIFAAYWLALGFVHLLSVQMPVGGLAGRLLVAFHEVSLDLIYPMVLLFAIWDIFWFLVNRSKKKNRGNQV